LASQGPLSTPSLSVSSSKQMLPPPSPFSPALKSPLTLPEPLPKPVLSNRRVTPPPKPSTIESSSVPSKIESKPAVPAKFDFRGNLKPRAKGPEDDKGNEPEFKNALNKLKRTQTKNYIAPDILKSNILQGKAGLNNNGGPAKRERVDEFKDSLVKQKDSIKVKAATEPKPEKPKELSSTPEALMARKALQRVVTPPTNAPSKFAESEAIRKRKEMEEKSKPVVAPKPTSSAEEANSKSAPLTQIKSAPTPVLTPALLTKSISPEPPKSKLMGRMNPALAGILARGPPGSGSSKETKSSSSSVTVASVEPAPKDSPQLTHMTKARARGPKRRAPKSVPEPTPIQEGLKTKDVDSSSSESPLKEVEPKPVQSPTPIDDEPVISPINATFAQKYEIMNKSRESIFTKPSPPRRKSPVEVIEAKAKPPTAPKSPDLSKKAKEFSSKISEPWSYA